VSQLPSDLIVAQQEIRDLRQALESRSIIDQAKGIIRAWLCSGEDEAWSALVGASQRHNIKVRVMAQQLVDLASSCDEDADGWLAHHVGPRGSGAPEVAVS
jgi:hypothetical protein